MDRYILATIPDDISGDASGTYYVVVDTGSTYGSSATIVGRGGVTAMAALRDALNGV